jgi:YidC/Oxa1 family membrane protein insertase
MQSMNEMRKLQPEIEKLKAKHGNDKEKLNLAVMQLYQQHKVNPLGGCLPMLIQMPIWFALYATLQTSVELYREPFLWLSDLTHYDPYYILPIAMGASSFLMQKISPQPADNTQAKMLLYFMPAFFTFIMLKLPSGLTLYILVNNLLSIAQQQWLMRKQMVVTPAKAA